MDRYCWTKYGMLKTDEHSESLYRHVEVDKEIEQLGLRNDGLEGKNEVLRDTINSQVREIERLKKGYKNIKSWISHVDMTSPIEAFQVVINEIIGIYKQAL